MDMNVNGLYRWVLLLLQNVLIMVYGFDCELDAVAIDRDGEFL
jgi:hypothetical protein